MGTKLKKTTLDSVGNLETVTTYIGPFQYQARAPLTGTGSGNLIDTLQFFAHPEGRVQVEDDTTDGETAGSFKYDYFLKDHLGNTRMVLTDEQQTDMYPAATMEVGDSATENLYYMNLDSTRATLPPGYPTDTTTNPNNYVAEVGGPSGSGSGPVIGPGIVLKVMAGDQFSIRVSSWYRLNGTTPGTPVNPLTDILAHLIAGMAGVSNPENPGLAALQTNSPVISPNVLQFLQDTGSNINSTIPHAFVNWILLDNQFNYVSASSGFSQVGSDGELHHTTLTNLPVTSSGYLYIYASNETPNVDVFFDNLQVTHTRGPLLEEDHYYPFGLTMAGISDKALKANYAENKYRYNDGTELQNKEFSDGSGWEMYETPFRSFDPQLGVFHQLDPLADITEGYSPYSFALDNPVSYNDAWGLQASDTTAKPATTSPNTDDVPLMPEAVVTATKKDCVTCDDLSVNAGPPPASGSAVASGPSESSLPAAALTVTTLGEGAAEGGGITITTTGGAIFWPIAVVGGSIYLDKYSRPRSLPALSLPQTIALGRDHTNVDARPLIYMYGAQPWGEQYTLRARADGDYPLYEWGKGQIGTTHLHRGDIWKIGTTINGSARYSQSFYQNTGMGLDYTPEYFGPIDHLIFVERMKLLNYAIMNGGTLPPGNTKLQ